MVVWAPAERGKKSLPTVLLNGWAVIPEDKVSFRFLKSDFKGVFRCLRK